MKDLEDDFSDAALAAKNAREEKEKEEAGPYAGFDREELETMLESRDYREKQRFRQKDSAITVTTGLLGDEEALSADDGADRVATMEELAAIYRVLVSDENLEMMSVLRKPRYVGIFGKAWTLVNKYEFEMGKVFLENLLKFAVSSGGLGRRQYLDAVRSAVMEADEGLEGGLGTLRDLVNNNFRDR